MTEGPLLETLTRRLAECPPEFLAEPRFGKSGQVQVAAVVADTLHALGAKLFSREQAAPFQQTDAKKYRNFYSLVLISCWLFTDDWFKAPGTYGYPALQFLTTELPALAEAVTAQKFITDPDRREELARLCLRALDVLPANETEAQAQDRLTTLNTAERQRVIAAARQAEERARQIREEMARKAAEEAADKWGRE